VVNWNGMLKSVGRSEGDHASHLWSWIEQPITWNLIHKFSYVNDSIKGGLMMWVSFIMDGNKQEGKWLAVECKALKWVNANNAPPKGSPWQVPMVEGMTMTLFSQLQWL
jgi:hypothetical protein